MGPLRAMTERASKLILFHGGFPDRFELRQQAATSRPESFLISSSLRLKSPRRFWEYYFDNPADGSVEVPKVGYARVFTVDVPSGRCTAQGFLSGRRGHRGSEGGAGESGGSALVSEWGSRCGAWRCRLLAAHMTMSPPC